MEVCCVSAKAKYVGDRLHGSKQYIHRLVMHSLVCFAATRSGICTT